MYIPPPDNNMPLEYYKREGEHQHSRAASGGIIFELLTVLWYVFRWLIKMALLPISFSIAQWKKRQNKRKLKVESKAPYEIQ